MTKDIYLYTAVYYCMRRMNKDGSGFKVDVEKEGEVTIRVSRGPASLKRPKGGVMNRMVCIQLCRTESWDSVIGRLLDLYEDTHMRASSRASTCNPQMPSPDACKMPSEVPSQMPSRLPSDMPSEVPSVHNCDA
jgi:hypothetical protein